MDTYIDFSNEDWGKSVKFYDGCWVIAEKHNPEDDPTGARLKWNIKNNK